MRVWRAAWVLGMALAGAAGCHDDKGAVLLFVSARSDGAFGLSSYSSSTAAVGIAADGQAQFVATSNEGLLTLQLPGPLVAGTVVELPLAPESVHFTAGGGEWGNQGGIVVVESSDPVIVRLAGVPMVARAGSALGSFVFDGTGTFR